MKYIYNIIGIHTHNRYIKRKIVIIINLMGDRRLVITVIYRYTKLIITLNVNVTRILL